LDLESALSEVLADDFQLAAEGLGGPVDQAAGEAPVRPDLADTRVDEPGPQQLAPGAVTILRARRDNMDGQKQADGVGDYEPLLSFSVQGEAMVIAGQGRSL
jgi:hypothetical protein